MMVKISNLDLVIINEHTKFGQICPLVLKIQANFNISNSKGMGKTLRVFQFEIANYDVHFHLNTLLDRFLNGILARKRHFRGAFAAH